MKGKEDDDNQEEQDRGERKTEREKEGEREEGRARRAGATHDLLGVYNSSPESKIKAKGAVRMGPPSAVVGHGLST